jgi:FkbM family methyltransferase
MTEQHKGSTGGAHMISDLFKRAMSKLPEHWQHEFRRAHYHRQIKRQTFMTGEPEYAILDSWIAPADWVIDVGANIGHYTRRFSELVGAEGRVIAIEPVSETFDLLAANVKNFAHHNVTLLNVAASDSTGLAGMNVPAFDTGLKNFYEAHLTQEGTSEMQVLTLAIDTLQLPRKVSVVKIDAEGHEVNVLRGMVELMKRDAPLLIVESARANLIEYLESLGYRSERLPDSPNLIWRYTAPYA